MARQVINESTKPRVLVHGYGDYWDLVTSQLTDHVGTVKRVHTLNTVSLDEWDCIVTSYAYAGIDQVIDEATLKNTYEIRRTVEQDPVASSWQWYQNVPDHISIVYLAPAERTGVDPLDFCPPSGSGGDGPGSAVVSVGGIQGSHISYAEDVPGYIDDLVRQQLVPAVRERDRHIAFEVRPFREGDESGPTIEPFLHGPQDAVLAGSYKRTADASVWLIPDDVPSPIPWVVAALREWHGKYPNRFPKSLDWADDDAWKSAEEQAILTRMRQLEGDFNAAVEDFVQKRDLLNSELSDASDNASHYERALLTEQGDPLQSAVLRGLRELGFLVQDMDEHWPQDARREDYRITDSDDPSWISIGEAKGFTKGVSEIGLQSLGRFVELYIAETKGQLPNARWYIANQFLRQDPSSRPAPLHGRSDVVNAFASAGGLLIDTRALFRLVRLVQAQPEVASFVRAYLRPATGILDDPKVNTLFESLSDS